MGHVYLDRMPNLQTLTHLEEMRRYWLPEETEEPAVREKTKDAAS